VPSKSAMRKATYSVPGAADGQEGEMAVFYFGPGQGGDIKANLDRWEKQFSDIPEGGATRSDRAVGDLQVHSIEITSGTYQNSMAPMAAKGGPQKDQALLGAVVVAPTGKYFFKFTGPKQTVQSNRKAFMAMLDSMKPASR